MFATRIHAARARRSPALSTLAIFLAITAGSMLGCNEASTAVVDASDRDALAADVGADSSARDIPTRDIFMRDPGTDVPAQDALVDAFVRDSSADVVAIDAAMDVISRDVGGDIVARDAAMDVVARDVGADVAAPDVGGSRPPASGNLVLDTCLGLTGVAERCTLVTNASACVTRPCSKLVVVFSGGEMGCITGPGYRTVLDGYAARGFAAVCINYFDTSTGSAASPYLGEAERLDVAVREATTGAWARAYWSGEDLLLQGISHGATAPVILMARTNLEDQPHWRGSRVTAGCFFDGAYDQAATADLLATGAVGGRPCTIPVSYNRWLERYCGAGATSMTCNLRTVQTAQDDTITAVAPGNFSIRDFRMFECGSALPACSGDIVAGPPVQDLCARIDASPAHTCSFVSLPTDGHLTCHSNQYDQCRTWFEGLIPR